MLLLEESVKQQMLNEGKEEKVMTQYLSVLKCGVSVLNDESFISGPSRTGCVCVCVELLVQMILGGKTNQYLFEWEQSGDYQGVIQN